MLLGHPIARLHNHQHHPLPPLFTPHPPLPPPIPISHSDELYHNEIQAFINGLLENETHGG
jgi:hypothetical protein